MPVSEACSYEIDPGEAKIYHVISFLIKWCEKISEINICSMRKSSLQGKQNALQSFTENKCYLK